MRPLINYELVQNKSQGLLIPPIAAFSAVYLNDVLLGETKLSELTISEIRGRSWQTVTTQGKNLLDIFHNYNDITVVPSSGTANNVVDGSGNLFVTNSSADGNGAGSVITVSADTVYSFQYTGTLSTLGAYPKVQILQADGTEIARLYCSDGGHVSVSFNTGTNTSAYIRYFRSGTQNLTDPVKFENIQLEIDAATAYAAFVPDSPSPMYPSAIRFSGMTSIIGITAGDFYTEVESYLLGSPNAADVIKDGVHYHNVTFFQFDGTEDWTKSAYGEEGDGVYRFYLTLDDTCKPDTIPICSHFLGDHLVNAWGDPNAKICAIHHTAPQFNIVHKELFGYSIEEFKAWLVAQSDASMPLTFFIESAEPFTTSMILPRVPVTYPETRIYIDCEADLIIDLE